MYKKKELKIETFRVYFSENDNGSSTLNLH